MNIRRIPVDQWIAQAKEQCVPRKHVAVKCCVCGTIQSMADLIAAGAGKDEAEVASFFAHDCVGRWRGRGGHVRGTPPGQGCDWSTYGLLRLHTTEVIFDSGNAFGVFELATPQEAQAHMRGEPQAWTPERIQLKRIAGWRLPEGAVKVDRTTPWGNPFTVGMVEGYTAQHAVADFRRWISGDLSVRSAGEPPQDLSPLRGKTLACWCKPSEPCHADVLLELANK